MTRSYNTVRGAGYPGRKGASGLAERIIRQMPPHSAYVELFAGTAAVHFLKRRAEANVLIDVCPRQIRWLKNMVAVNPSHPALVLELDALQFVSINDLLRHRDTIAYVDPPYLRPQGSRRLYDWDFSTPEEHEKLLKALRKLPCMVMVSGYATTLYEGMLEDWRKIEIPAMTHGGLRSELLWMNFAEPELLHDSRFAGKDFRERERIKRKRSTWKRRFAEMPATERQVIAEALAEADATTLAAAMSAAKGPRPSSSTRNGRD